MSIKKRNPWLVLLFFILTFGLYGVYWIFSTTKELNQTTSSSPNIKLLIWYVTLFILGGISFFIAAFSRPFFLLLTFYIIGGLFFLAGSIIAIIFAWRYSKAIEEISCFSARNLFLIWIFVGIAMPVVAQYQLNKKASLK